MFEGSAENISWRVLTHGLQRVWPCVLLCSWVGRRQWTGGRTFESLEVSEKLIVALPHAALEHKLMEADVLWLEVHDTLMITQGILGLKDSSGFLSR